MNGLLINNGDNVNDFAVDGNGNIYTIPSTSGISKYSPATGTSVTIDPARNFQNATSLVVGAAGNIYVEKYTYPTYFILEISPQGKETVLSSEYGTVPSPSGMAVDALGNLYVADENASTLIEVTPIGSQFALPSLPGIPGNSSVLPDEVVYAAGTLYLWAEVNDSELFTYSIAGPNRPTLLNLQSSMVTENGSPSQSVSATWTSGGGATGYTCTLMYGFNLPSTFVQRTTSTNCSFTGLDPATTYGVQVVANPATGTSNSVTDFVSPATMVPPQKKTIFCIKNGGTTIRRVAAANPRCLAGYVLLR